MVVSGVFAGNVVTITERQYDDGVWYLDGVLYHGWSYKHNLHPELNDWAREPRLRPLPPEKKSTWDDFEEIVKWRPVEVVV